MTFSIIITAHWSSVESFPGKDSSKIVYLQFFFCTKQLARAGALLDKIWGSRRACSYLVEYVRGQAAVVAYRPYLLAPRYFFDALCRLDAPYHLHKLLVVLEYNVRLEVYRVLAHRPA